MLQFSAIGLLALIATAMCWGLAIIVFRVSVARQLSILLVVEGADRLFEAELGAWVGLLTSALLIFFLAPLQRFAEHFAGAVMPNTSDTPEYAAYRKLQVYEAALADALPGGISATGERYAPLFSVSLAMSKGV